MSVRRSVRPLVRHGDRVEEGENAQFWCCHCDFLCAWVRWKKQLAWRKSWNEIIDTKSDKILCKDGVLQFSCVQFLNSLGSCLRYMPDFFYIFFRRELMAWSVHLSLWWLGVSLCLSSFNLIIIFRGYKNINFQNLSYILFYIIKDKQKYIFFYWLDLDLYKIKLRNFLRKFFKNYFISYNDKEIISIYSKN